jgi:hypothetical protein
MKHNFDSCSLLKIPLFETELQGKRLVGVDLGDIYVSKSAACLYYDYWPLIDVYHDGRDVLCETLYSLAAITVHIGWPAMIILDLKWQNLHRTGCLRLVMVSPGCFIHACPVDLAMVAPSFPLDSPLSSKIPHHPGAVLFADGTAAGPSQFPALLRSMKVFIERLTTFLPAPVHWLIVLHNGVAVHSLPFFP